MLRGGVSEGVEKSGCGHNREHQGWLQGRRRDRDGGIIDSKWFLGYINLNER